MNYYKILLLLTILFEYANLSQAQVMYSEDFSENPLYTSIASEYAFWDSENENYFVNTYDNLSNKYWAYSPKFSTVKTDSDFTFELDINFVKPVFGTYPGISMYNEEPVEIKTDNFSFSINMAYSTSHYKHLRFVKYGVFDYYTDTVENNNWYHIKIKYKSEGQTADIMVTDIKTNSIFFELEEASFGISDFSWLGIGFYDNADYGHDWSPIRVDNINIKQDNANNAVFGKIVTASEIVGYTANVGGATIKALPYNLSTVTDIYGDFQINKFPMGECILQIESSYFKTITKTIQVNNGNNYVNTIEIFKPKCQNMYTQQEVDQLLDYMQAEKDAIISEKEETINQLNTSIATMYTQGYLDKAIAEAEKRGELKYDINNDGKVGLEEIIKYLETISGIRVESLIIFPDNKKHFLSE